jgi:hypothetical protein
VSDQPAELNDLNLDQWRRELLSITVPADLAASEVAAVVVLPGWTIEYRWRRAS